MSQAEVLFLGIEGGGTRTVALLVNDKAGTVERAIAGPANLKLLSDRQLVGHFREIAHSVRPRPDAMAIGLAGAWAESDWKRIRGAAGKVWPRVPCYATNDLETALTAAEDHLITDGAQKVLVVSGTGSCCYGKGRDGRRIKVGGWGHVLGDKGSGYEIGLRGLKAALYYYDQAGIWPRLGRQMLLRLQLNEPRELIGWAQAATKSEIASLAIEVLQAWRRKDKIAADILNAAANSLARDAAACAKRLARPGTRIHFILAGSILLKQPRFASRVRAELRKLWPNAIVSALKRESVWGAVELARRFKGESPGRSVASRIEGRERPALKAESAEVSPTERRHRLSMKLDQMPLGEAIKLMLLEDSKVPKKVLAEREHIERAVRAIVKAFRTGGRLFYVGAGTSGRLGVLDASECPPTFRTPPDQVQAIIAGGRTALWKSVEGAEDDVAAGERAIEFRDVASKDVVVGIAASGTTPFVWGALREAKRRRARTVMVCFNPFLKIPTAWRPTVVISPNLGPELLTGSTRLKAGTATKLILNIFSTLSMVQTGKVIGNLMVDLLPANEKLRDRAARIVQELTGVNYPAARSALKRNGWVIKKAVARLKS